MRRRLGWPLRERLRRLVPQVNNRREAVARRRRRARNRERSRIHNNKFRKMATCVRHITS